MARDAAEELNTPIEGVRASKTALERALLREQAAELEEKRVLAQKRAVAAEFIAQEANALRLRALLGAARDQATVKTIDGAEQRFAAARNDWEAAQQPYRPATEDHEGVVTLEPSMLSTAPVWRVAVPLALVVAVLAAGGYVYVDAQQSVGEAIETARYVAAQAADPASAAPLSLPNVDPAVSAVAATPISRAVPDIDLVGVDSVAPPVHSTRSAAADSPASQIIRDRTDTSIASPAVKVAAGTFRGISAGVMTPAAPAAAKVGMPAKSRAKRVAVPTPGRNPFRIEPAASVVRTSLPARLEVE